MLLLPINTPDRINRVATRRADRSDYQWPDFGNGVLSPSATSLRMWFDLPASEHREIADV
jgi:hypothetical protein